MSQKEYPQSTDLDVPLTNFLLYTKKITEAHQKQRLAQGKPSSWSDDSQIARMHEEVSEVYRAIRKDEGKARKIHECLDVMFATFTEIILDEDITFEDVATELQVVCKKLESRYFK